MPMKRPVAMPPHRTLAAMSDVNRRLQEIQSARSAMTSSGGSVGDDPAVTEEKDTVGVRERKVDVVRDEVDALEAGDRVPRPS